MPRTEPVGEDEPLEAGQRYQSVYKIEIPSYIPFNDVAARLTGDAIGLQEEINNELPGGNQLTIQNKELRETDKDGVWHYVITYRVESVDQSNPVTPASLTTIIYGIIAVAALAGIAISLMETRKILQTDGGSTVLLAGMGLLGYLAYSANKRTGE